MNAISKSGERSAAARRELVEAKALLCELLRQFYNLGWCTGTGGGIAIRVGEITLMAPSGVAKERVRPRELFELDDDFRPTNLERLSNTKISECAPLFQAIMERRGAGAVIHSHSVQLVLAMSLDRASRFLTFERLEMIKGIRGAGYLDRHQVPVIENTPKECDLLASLEDALEALPDNAHGVFVRDHGAYIWGRDAMEAKRHAECYDWLCQYQVAARRLVSGSRGDD